MAVKRYVTTDRKPKDPKDETGKTLSQVERLRRLESKNRELDRHNADLQTEIVSLKDQVKELKDVLVDFCSTMADSKRTDHGAQTTKLMDQVSALTSDHERETRTFLPDDA